MNFLIVAYDGKDEGALERRMRVRPDHFANVMKIREKGHVHCAGGITNEAGQLIGSMLVVSFDTREQLDEYLKTEPYVVNNVWQDIRIDTCNVAIKDDVLITM